MTAHVREIRAFDASLPVLPQATLLTDAQLRTTFAPDPLAGAH